MFYCTTYRLHVDSLLIWPINGFYHLSFTGRFTLATWPIIFRFYCTAFSSHADSPVLWPINRFYGKAFFIDNESNSSNGGAVRNIMGSMT